MYNKTIYKSTDLNYIYFMWYAKMLPTKLRSREHKYLSIPNQQDLKRALLPMNVRFGNFLRRSLGPIVEPVYDPMKLDNSEPLTDGETFISILKCAFGSGFLAMPKAFSNIGWIYGLLFTTVFGFLVCSALHILLNDMTKLCERHDTETLSYNQGLTLGLRNGPPLLQPLRRLIVAQTDFFMFIYHFGIACVYVIFLSKNLKMLGDIYLYTFDVRIYMAVLTSPLLFIFLIRDLKFLVPISVIAQFCMLIGFFCISNFVFRDLPSLSERQATQDWRRCVATIPLFFGTVLFAVESVSTLVALRNSMESPEDYLTTGGVLNQAMIVVIFFYTAFGFFGYWKYGESTNDSIINNLPIDKGLSQWTMILFSISIYFMYTLQGYVLIEIVFRNYVKGIINEESERNLDTLTRMAFVVGSVLCAMAFPNFGMMLSLVGSFCLAQVGIIFPGILNICVCYDDGYGPFNILLWRSLLYIAVGLVGGIIGTVIEVKSLI